MLSVRCQSILALRGPRREPACIDGWMGWDGWDGWMGWMGWDGMDGMDGTEYQKCPLIFFILCDR